ncbi:MAG TPA: AglZ/HisF2 family acetamidino modification protein [Chitinophagaceae bacterium]|nr:AglZ/HisF2 family acetamidino modification protein [Chitinophagaceae bacterium]
MQRIRVIPVLLLKNQGLVKTKKFKDPKYLGDPINAVKIFNDKEVDELAFLDITASIEKREPNYKVIEEIASECFMPLSYGGGITTFDQAKILFNIGVEKLVINTSAFSNPDLITKITEHYGAQALAVCIDTKKSFLGKYEVYIHSGTKNTGRNPISYALEMQKLGAGEIIIQSIDKDGTMQGYDIDLIHKVSTNVGIPVIACGGAGTLQHFTEAIKQGGASAVSAGSMFVFHGKHKAVLISYPSQEELQRIFN